MVLTQGLNVKEDSLGALTFSAARLPISFHLVKGKCEELGINKKFVLVWRYEGLRCPNP